MSIIHCIILPGKPDPAKLKEQFVFTGSNLKLLVFNSKYRNKIFFLFLVKRAIPIGKSFLKPPVLLC